MEEDSVSGLFSVYASFCCSEHDVEVSVKDNQPNYHQKQNIGGISLLEDEGIWEDIYSDTKDSGIKEVQRLCGQSD